MPFMDSDAMRFPKTIIIIFLLAFSSAPSLAWQLKGFKNPESFIVDPATGFYYVSNLNGRPAEKNNNGFISRIDPAGKLDIYFIQSGKNKVQLHSPKGLAVLGDELFVADLDAVWRFDKVTGQPLQKIEFSHLGVRMLDDLAVGPGELLYVTDVMGDAIYSMDMKNNFQIRVVAQSPNLGKPNGLLYDWRNNLLLVVTWKSGLVLGIDKKGNILSMVPHKFGNLDGIAFDSVGNLIVSAIKEGTLYRIRNYHIVETLATNLNMPADISFDSRNKQLLVPLMHENIVFTLPENQLEQKK